MMTRKKIGMYSHTLERRGARRIIVVVFMMLPFMLANGPEHLSMCTEYLRGAKGLGYYETKLMNTVFANTWQFRPRGIGPDKPRLIVGNYSCVFFS